MAENFPLPIPNGWFAVCFSDELAPGQVVPMHFFGRDLVAFRDETGVARVLDAHCPHLGAHLGHGGTVVGNSIRCPFHAWEWDGETGGCAAIPYAKKIPPKARVGVWPTAERNQMVLVWHHLGGETPDWEVGDFEETSQRRLVRSRAFRLDDPDTGAGVGGERSRHRPLSATSTGRRMCPTASSIWMGRCATRCARPR